MSDGAASAAAIELTGLEVQLGGRPVLGPLRLRVEPQEYVLVLGASGSGKTTLLRAIAGLLRPTAGRVELFGERASEGSRILIGPERRSVGFLFQGGGLWPHLTVERTLEFVLQCRKVPRAQRRRHVAELVDLVELSGLEQRLPSQLSGGEGQRLALARALAVEPRILLLDEPLGPVDAELRESLIARLAEVSSRRRITTLHVTHDPREVRRLATRAVRIQAGSVEPATEVVPAGRAAVGR